MNIDEKTLRSLLKRAWKYDLIDDLGIDGLEDGIDEVELGLEIDELIETLKDNQ